MFCNDSRYISEQIVSIADVPCLLKSFGVEIRGNRCRCPIHNGKDWNVKVFKNGIHCFVCNKSFDALHITQHFHNCGWITAAKYLDGMYGLGLLKPLTAEERRDRDNKVRLAAEKRENEKRRKEYHLYSLRRICAYKWWLEEQPETSLSRNHIEWCNRLIDRAIDGIIFTPEWDVDSTLAGMWQQHKTGIKTAI